MNIDTTKFFKALEPILGTEASREFVDIFNQALDRIDENSRGIAPRRKSGVREELRIEMREDLATKADLAKLQGSIDTRFEQVNTIFERVDKKSTMMFSVLVFLIVFLNQDALQFLLRMLRVI